MSPVRAPDITRKKILEISAEVIHQNGFKATSLSDILSRTDISKGALYHHFKNKLELGYAVFDEIFVQHHLENWRQATAQPDPLKGISDWLVMMSECMDESDMACGCPINNISQEMSAIDEGFRNRIARMIEQHVAISEQALSRAIDEGIVKKDTNPRQVALFLSAACQGCAGMVKITRSRDVFRDLATSVTGYLDSLRAETPG